MAFTYTEEWYYEAGSFTVATGQTNRDIRANEPTLWKSINQATAVRISTDQTVTLRFNDATYWPIVMTSSQSPMMFDRVRVSNLYVTNASGSTANMKIEIYQ